MTSRSPRRQRLLAAGAALCCGSLLTLPAAHAATTGWDPAQSNLVGIAGIGTLDPTGTSPCTITGPGITAPDTSMEAIGTNVTKSYTATATGTATSDTDPTDKVTMTTKVTGTGRLSQSGGRATGVDVSFRGSSSVQATKAHSACRIGSEGGTGVSAVFTLDRPTIVTMEGTSHGLGGLEVGIQPGSSAVGGSIDPSASGAVFDLDLNPSTRVHRTTWLPAGQYTLIAIGVVLQLDSSQAGNTSGTGEVHVSFGKAGSRLARSGSSRFVKMPRNRNCAKGVIRPEITHKRKLVKRIKHVVFNGPHFVDRMVKHSKIKHMVKHPKRSHKVKLRSNNSAPVVVHVRVRLRNGKLIDSTASYRQCVAKH